MNEPNPPDIVTRLRDIRCTHGDAVEAAAEIERMQAELNRLQAALDETKASPRLASV